MQIETVDSFSEALGEIAVRSADATFYHTAVWVESLSRAFPAMRFQCLVARNGSEVLGYLPFFVAKRGPISAAWSLPFATYGGPVALGDEDVCRSLVGAYAALRKRRGIHEVGLVDFWNRLELPGFRREGATTHIIALDGGFDDVWDRAFEKSKRRQARKASREGLVVEETRSPEDVSRYHRLYAERVRDWNERFAYPEALFAGLLSGGKGTVRLFVARLGGELVGGHLNFYFRDHVIAWNGVTRGAPDGAQTSTLLYAECIRHACENGYLSYNLGGSLGKGSLVDYKEALGGVSYRYRTLRWRSAIGKAAGVVKTVVARH